MSEVPLYLLAEEVQPPWCGWDRLTLGPFGSSSSQHRRTLELILQEGSASFQASNPIAPPPTEHSRYRGYSSIRTHTTPRKVLCS